MQDDTDLTPMLEEMWALYYADEIAHGDTDFEFDGNELLENLEYFKHPDYKFISDEGGCEGQGDTGVIVFEWKGKFYKFECYYASYDGRNYEGAASSLREVKPVQRMVTFYE